MKKLFLSLLLTLGAAVLSAQPTLVGGAHFPSTENSDPGLGAGDTTNDPVTITPPTSQAGDFVLVYLTVRTTTTTTLTINDAAGQNWRCTARTPAGNSNAAQGEWLCWTFFNGTWGGSGNLIVYLPSTADSDQGTMVVLRGTQKGFSPIDAFATGATADETSSTVATSANSTLVDNSWAINFFGSRDDNTWTVDNSMTKVITGDAQIYWRNLEGSDSSHVSVFKNVATAGAVGVTTATQATLGADGGVWMTMAIRPSSAARRGGSMS